MNHAYLSTFITGFSDLVKNNLTKHINISKINLLLDSLIVYQSPADIANLRKTNYLNNTFIVLKQFNQSNNTPTDSMLHGVLSDKNIFKKIPNYVKKPSSFRLIISKENQLVSADKKLLTHIENKLSKIKNLHPNRLKPDIEFWLLIRNENIAFFCLRLTKKPNQEKNLEKGELRPELASILCLISGPQNDDIFMDPFCGHGSIPIQRLFIPKLKYQQIIASDKNPKLVTKLKTKIKTLKKKKTIKHFSIKNFEALDLKSIPDNLITKIVTDPPWGLRSSKINHIEDFRNKMLNEFYRVLAPNGVLVILAKKQIFDKTLKKHQNKFKLRKHYTTLVSGQKASVYKFKKI